jgi:hypothetical protein
MGDVEEDHGQGEENRQLGRRALHAHGEPFQAIPGGLIGGPVPAAPVHVENFKERDPPIFRGLPHEDVMEWSYQFQRVSAFNQWGPAQQYRHIEFSLEGVAAKWLTGLNPRPETIDGLMGALQAAFRHHNYALELESQLRNRKMGPDEPVMSYCYEIIYLCSKVDPAMAEERKVQHIFQNMEPTLVQKVFPQMDGMNTAELFRRLQAHSQAALIAGRSIPVNQILPTPPASSKAEIEKLVREEVTKSLDPIVRKLEEATRSLDAGRGSRDNWRERTGERDRNPWPRQQDRPNKRTVDPYATSAGSRAISPEAAQTGRTSSGGTASTVGSKGISPVNVRKSNGRAGAKVNRSRPSPPRPNHPPGTQTKSGGRGERTTVVLNFPQTDSRRLILKQVDCQGQIVKAIIDTGSGVSLVSPKFCRMLGVDEYREWSGPRLLLMDGNTLVPNGSVKLRIYVEGRLVWITAAVSE